MASGKKTKFQYNNCSLPWGALFLNVPFTEIFLREFGKQDQTVCGSDQKTSCLASSINFFCYCAAEVVTFYDFGMLQCYACKRTPIDKESHYQLLRMNATHSICRYNCMKK